MQDRFLGKKLDGRYEMRERIGVGGMATVYKAYDIIDDRYVSVKILKEEYLRDAEFLRRFRNESKAVAVLSHPNVVKVYNVSFGDRIQYLVMEYIEGITLKEYLDQQTVINWKDAIHFTAQILKALHHAHEKGVIHRDIKPHNIMLLNNGAIKVTDFGIARFAKSETRTMTDKAIGSVHYIAPEQARGDLTDSKSDIYSVGVMLYEMLTGKLPFEADSAVSVAIMQLQTEPEPPCNINPAIPRGLEEITLKAMQKEPSKRYKSAMDMLKDIKRFHENPNIIFNYDYYNDDCDINYDSIAPAQNSRSYPEYASNRNMDYDDADSYIESNSKPKKKKIALISAVLAVVLLFVLFFVVNFFSAKDVELPNFVGQKYADITQKKNEGTYKFKFERKDGYDISKAEGEVLDQNPKYTSGKKVKSNTTILLTVNNLGGSFPVPDVTGKTKENAMYELQQAGLSPAAVSIVDDSVDKGLVINTNPAVGTAVKSGDPVTIYISSGPAETKVKVPNVLNQSYEKAKSEIESTGLKIGTVSEKDSAKEKGTVLETDPLPTTSVKSGSAVSLVISSGTKPETSVDIDVKLPSDSNKDMTFKVFVDGKLDGNFTRTVNPSQNEYTSVSVAGNGGQSTITVKLDDELYYTYVVDFDKQSILTSTKNPEYKKNNSQSSTSSRNDSDNSNSSSSKASN